MCGVFAELRGSCLNTTHPRHTLSAPWCHPSTAFVQWWMPLFSESVESNGSNREGRDISRTLGTSTFSQNINEFFEVCRMKFSRAPAERGLVSELVLLSASNDLESTDEWNRSDTVTKHWNSLLLSFPAFWRLCWMHLDLFKKEIKTRAGLLEAIEVSVYIHFSPWWSQVTSSWLVLGLNPNFILV